MGELIFEAVLAIIGAAMFFVSFSFRESIIDQSGGPGLFPRIVIIMLFVALAARAFVVLRNDKEKAKKFTFFEMFMGNRLIFLLIFLAYILLVRPLGFLISTWAFMLITIPFLYKLQYGKRMSGKAIAIESAISIAGVFILYYVFSECFNVLLPAGLLGF